MTVTYTLFRLHRCLVTRVTQHPGHIQVFFPMCEKAPALSVPAWEGRDTLCGIKMTRNTETERRRLGQSNMGNECTQVYGGLLIPTSHSHIRLLSCLSGTQHPDAGWALPSHPWKSRATPAGCQGGWACPTESSGRLSMETPHSV